MGWFKSKSGELIGDGPADIIGEAIAKTANEYLLVHGRRPTKKEMEACIEFCVAAYTEVPEEKKLTHFCDTTCNFLDVNERRQCEIKERTGKTVDHCCKYTGEKLKHGVFHPKIVTSKQCPVEGLSYKIPKPKKIRRPQ